MQQWSDDNRPGAAAALALASQPSIFLSTIQVGITLIGVTSGAFGEAKLASGLAEWLARWPWLEGYAEGLSVTLIVGGITVVSLVVGELVPKRVALLNPEAIASAVAKPMQLLSRLAHPVVRALSWVTEGVLRLLRLRAMTPAPVTEEEIKVLMDQGARAGVPISTWRTLARNLLAEALAGKPFEPARHMVKPLFVPTGISAMELVEQFRKRRQTIAIAVNEHGAVDGVVTVNDVMEALVGDIAVMEEA
ncbi:MAG: CNNM domain-containing protein [Betaproteobacteria bacterium]